MGDKIIMKKLDYETCNLVLDYISDNFGYSDEASRDVLVAFNNRIKVLQAKQHTGNIFEWLFTNKKIKEFKRALSEVSNDTVESVYSEYALDYLKADKEPLNLKEIIEKAQERQRLAIEQDSEKSID